jgi:sugar phosphate isomerase/epimerase
MMAEDKIKLAYFVATPELCIDEKVTAYQGDMETAFHKLSELGYDGAELMILDPDIVDRDRVQQLSREYDIDIPVLCTGEVYGQGGLSFMDPDQSIRTEAILRMKKIIDFAAPFGAQVNIGRLRGQFTMETPQETSLAWMYAAFEEVTDYAAQRGVTIILEPVPYIFCNNINSTRDGIAVVRRMGRENFRLMADIFSMNLEDVSMERSFNDAKPYLTHIHVCDSNRLAPGRGNLDFGKILSMIKASGYTGYISAEINQHPDQDIVIEEAVNVLSPLL